MKKIFMLIILLAILLPGCQTFSVKAVRVRTELSIDTSQQLRETSEEIKQLVDVIMTKKAEDNFKELKSKYDSTLEKIKQTYENDSDKLVIKTSQLSAAYEKGLKQTKENLINETKRLYVIASKVKTGADAVLIINRMADEEVKINQRNFDEIKTIISSSAMEILIMRLEEKYSIKEQSNE
ncbi:MAG: hypothetical protein ACOCV1_03045 [Bacillota bacterium]